MLQCVSYIGLRQFCCIWGWRSSTIVGLILVGWLISTDIHFWLIQIHGWYLIPYTLRPFDICQKQGSTDYITPQQRSVICDYNRAVSSMINYTDWWQYWHKALMYQLDKRAGLITFVTDVTGSSTGIRFRFYHGLSDPREHRQQRWLS